MILVCGSLLKVVVCGGLCCYVGADAADEGYCTYEGMGPVVRSPASFVSVAVSAPATVLPTNMACSLPIDVIPVCFGMPAGSE